MLKDSERMVLAEQRIQQLQDAALSFYAWSGYIGNCVAGMQAQMTDMQRDIKQTQRVMIAVAKHLNLDLDDDQPAAGRE